MSAEQPQLDRPLLPAARSPLTVGQVLRILRARWQTIAITVGVFLALAVVVVLLMPDRYVARVSMLIEFPGDDPATGQQYPSNLAESYQATQVDLLTSYKVRLAVVDALHMTDDAKARKAFQASAERGASFRQWLAQQLARNVAVATDQTSHLVEVAYQARNADRSARVANALVSQYMDASNQIVFDPARQRRDQYSKLLATLRQNVDDAQTKLSQEQQTLQVIDTDNAGALDTQRLQDLGLKLNQAETAHQEAQAKVDQIQALRKAGQPITAQADILDSSFIQDLKGRLLSLQSQRAELAHELGPNHPRIRSLNAQIATVSGRLGHEIDDYIQSNRSAAQITANQQDALSQSYARERGDVLSEQKKRAELDKYQRQFASARQVYQAALNQYDQVLGGSQLNRENISVVSWAAPPTAPTGLSAKRKLVLAVLLGLLVGSALALLRELLDRRVRAGEDITREVGLPLLGDLTRATR